MSDYTAQLPFDQVEHRHVGCVCGGPLSDRKKIEHNGWRFNRCQCCKTYVLTPRPSEAVISRFYQDHYDYAGAGSDLEFALQDHLVHPWSLYKTGKRIQLIKRATAGKRLLDFGCGFGQFLAFAKRHFECEGFEISRNGSQTVSKNLSIPVFSDLKKLGIQPKYSVVTSFHVFEHVLNPAGMLRQLHQIIKPGGILLLTVPNGDSVALRLLNGKWEWCAFPLHNYLFSRKGLVDMIKKAGFRVEYTCSEIGDMPSPRTLLRSVQRMLGRSGAYNNTRLNSPVTRVETPRRKVKLYRATMTNAIKLFDPLFYLMNRVVHLGGELILVARKLE